MAQQQQKNTRIKAPKKPLIPSFNPPQFQNFKKPLFGKQQNFSSAFRTQSKGGGGK